MTPISRYKNQLFQSTLKIAELKALRALDPSRKVCRVGTLHGVYLCTYASKRLFFQMAARGRHWRLMGARGAFCGLPAPYMGYIYAYTTKCIGSNFVTRRRRRDLKTAFSVKSCYMLNIYFWNFEHMFLGCVHIIIYLSLDDSKVQNPVIVKCWMPISKT